MFGVFMVDVKLYVPIGVFASKYTVSCGNGDEAPLAPPDVEDHPIKFQSEFAVTA